jgi:predicted GNAT superfamily acetyltransferase
MIDARTAPAEQKAVIPEVRDVSEVGLCVELQRRIWGYSDLDICPDHIAIVAKKTGGQILGAYVGERAIGFALAFAAMRDGETYLHSHMVGVLPQYQDGGIGRLLKIAQRDDAIARGIKRIEWTFDPLQLKNAYFNIAKLGVIIRHFIPDFYGRTSSPLHAGLATDRLVAEWWVNSLRVVETLGGKSPEHRSKCERVAVPKSIREICLGNPESAAAIQSRVGARFEELFAQGYAVVGFEFTVDNGIYLLEPYED